MIGYTDGAWLFFPSSVFEYKINYKVNFTNTWKHTHTPNSVKLIGCVTKLLLLKWSKVQFRCLLCLSLMKNSATCAKLFQSQSDLFMFINKHKFRAWIKTRVFMSSWKLIWAGAKWGQITRESENSEYLFFPQGKVNLRRSLLIKLSVSSLLMLGIFNFCC